MKEMMAEKKGIVWQELMPWIIGFGVLIFAITIYILLKGKGEGAIAFLKNLIRFRA